MNETTGSEAQGERPEPDTGVPPQDGKARAPTLAADRVILASKTVEVTR